MFIVDGHRLEIEINTGAGYSLISESEWQGFVEPKLKLTKFTLTTYTGEPMGLKGEYEARIKMGTQEQLLPLYVLRGADRPSLCGRNGFVIRLNWATILYVPEKTHQTLEGSDYLIPFLDVFNLELGTIKVPPAHLDLQPGAVLPSLGQCRLPCVTR